MDDHYSSDNNSTPINPKTESKESLSLSIFQAFLFSLTTLMFAWTIIGLLLIPLVILWAINKKRKILAVLFPLSFIPWIILIYFFGTSPPPSANVVTLEWHYLMPSNSTYYSTTPNKFGFSITNTIGAPIKITEIKVTENLSKPGGSVCVPYVNGKSNSEIASSPEPVAVGEKFVITGICQSAERLSGDPYEMKVFLNYTTIFAQISVSKTENGIIRGFVE